MTPKTGDGAAPRAPWIGMLLGLALSAGLVAMVVHGGFARLDAARRQSAAVAAGIDKLLRYEIRNLERALNGMASEADGYAADPAAWDLPGAIRGVVARNGELQDIDLVGRDGRLLYHGVDAPAQAVPPDVLRSSATGRLVPGAVLHEGRSQPVVPLVVRTPKQNWLVAYLHASELQEMLGDADLGRRGSISLLGASGQVLAQRRPGAWPPATAANAPPLRPSWLHSLEAPIVGRSAASGYPFEVVVSLSRRDVLEPWFASSAASLGLLLLYWAGMIHLTRRVAAAEAVRRTVHAELQRQADWLGKAQEAARMGVWAMDAANDEVHASAHARQLFGLPPGTAPLPARAFFERIHERDRSRIEAEFADAWNRGAAFAFEYRVALPDGTVRWISARGAPVAHHDAGLRMTGTITDITERRRQQARLQRAEAQFRELFERNPLPFWVFDIATLRFLAVNAAAVQRYGYSREEFLAMTILQIRPEQAADEVRDSVADTAEPRDSRPVWQHVTRDGRLIHVRVHSSTIRFDGRDARLVLAEDVSERVAYERDLEWRATHEESTGLLHLRALLDAVDARGAGGGTGTHAFVHVQLRDLELVSPTFGPRTRDEIVLHVARRIEQVVQRHGLVAYLPSDAFVLAMWQAENWHELVDEMKAALAAPIESATGRHRVQAWLGVAFQQAGEPAEQAAGHAVLAALEARAHNQASMLYSASMAERAAERLATVGRLRTALANEEFELVYQPILRIGDGRVTGAEALLRWRVDGRHVSPATFIPLCEESGMIVPIGEWVIDQAAQARQQLGARGHDAISIAVNISAVQFMSGAVPRSLRRAHARYRLPRGALHVELTETAMLQRPEIARAAMEELQREGVCVSIDDFGTGFSSMGYLRDLPLNHLKIDRSFVQDVHRDPRNASICQALIALGRGLGLELIAEGVEHPLELQWLRGHGVDSAQGFLIARPMRLEDFASWLDDHPDSGGAGAAADAG
ncbi:bifunctional diguanylate cyclase/phosphodiesterase [Stenotrophomonas acidaminiphila]